MVVLLHGDFLDGVRVCPHLLDRFPVPRVDNSAAKPSACDGLGGFQFGCLGIPVQVVRQNPRLC